jgi:uncharacterized repeat protein (TIGR03943 family)
MNREAQDNLLLLLGALLLQVGFTDLHLRYVKPAMQPLIVLTGVGLLAVGLVGVLRRVRSGVPDVGSATEASTAAGLDAHGHSHHAGPRAAWLLVLPLLVMATVTPPSLGAYAAARSSSTLEAPTFEPPPLPASVGGVVELSLTDYYTRAMYYPDPLRDVPVRLSGFVTPVDGEWYVTRIALSCCAADGRPIKILADGAAARPAPAADSWVEVVGTWTTPRRPAHGELQRVATLHVSSVRETPRPQNAYEP